MIKKKKYTEITVEQSYAWYVIIWMSVPLRKQKPVLRMQHLGYDKRTMLIYLKISEKMFNN